jgi:hypothetical protein
MDNLSGVSEPTSDNYAAPWRLDEYRDAEKDYVFNLLAKATGSRVWVPEVQGYGESQLGYQPGYWKDVEGTPVNPYQSFLDSQAQPHPSELISGASSGVSYDGIPEGAKDPYKEFLSTLSPAQAEEYARVLSAHQAKRGSTMRGAAVAALTAIGGIGALSNPAAFSSFTSSLGGGATGAGGGLTAGGTTAGGTGLTLGGGAGTTLGTTGSGLLAGGGSATGLLGGGGALLGGAGYAAPAVFSGTGTALGGALGGAAAGLGGAGLGTAGQLLGGGIGSSIPAGSAIGLGEIGAGSAGASASAALAGGASAGAGAGGGLLNTLTGALPAGALDVLKAGGLIGGAIAGSKETPGDVTTQQSKTDPRVDPYIYGDNGVLKQAQDWYTANKSGVNPNMQAGWDARLGLLSDSALQAQIAKIKAGSQGLLSAPIAGNPWLKG